MVVGVMKTTSICCQQAVDPSSVLGPGVIGASLQAVNCSETALYTSVALAIAGVFPLQSKLQGSSARVGAGRQGAGPLGSPGPH